MMRSRLEEASGAKWFPRQQQREHGLNQDCPRLSLQYCSAYRSEQSSNGNREDGNHREPPGRSLRLPKLDRKYLKRLLAGEALRHCHQANPTQESSGTVLVNIDTKIQSLFRHVRSTQSTTHQFGKSNDSCRDPIRQSMETYHPAIAACSLGRTLLRYRRRPAVSITLLKRLAKRIEWRHGKPLHFSFRNLTWSDSPCARLCLIFRVTFMPLLDRIHWV